MAGVLGFADGDNDASSSRELDAWVEKTLKEEFGLVGLTRDEDGDFPVPHGSSVVFVRRLDPDRPFLNIFAPLLHDFTVSPAVYEAVNSINMQVPFAKAIVTDDRRTILMVAELPAADHLSAHDLVLAIDLVTDAADHFDTLLQKRFGGTTMLDDDDDEIEV